MIDYQRNNINKNMKQSIKKRLRCPDCHSTHLVFDVNQIECKNCNSQFPLIRDTPILMKKDNEVFSISEYLKIAIKDKPKKKPLLAKIIPSPSVNLSYSENLKALGKALADVETAYILVVGGGQQKEGLDKILAEFQNIELIYCDIDINATIDLFCDAHELPFLDNVFHGIITTAVLEHVLYPERVVSEINRVLMNQGVIYSEIPFMQQVHEGAYDFTRYTLSGHRRLMNHFCELSSGLVSGPGTALVWSIENFALCFAWSRTSRLLLKAGVRLLFFWVKYFDYLFKNNPQALDGACCTYFMGRKEPNRKTSDKIIIEEYEGADYVRHV